MHRETFSLPSSIHSRLQLRNNNCNNKNTDFYTPQQKDYKLWGQNKLRFEWTEFWGVKWTEMNYFKTETYYFQKARIFQKNVPYRNKFIRKFWKFYYFIQMCSKIQLPLALQ